MAASSGFGAIAAPVIGEVADVATEAVVDFAQSKEAKKLAGEVADGAKKAVDEVKEVAGKVGSFFSHFR